MVNKIEKIRDGLYVKRSILGYRVVYPYKNDDGTINWFNLIVGGWGNLLFVLFVMLLVFGFIYVYHHDFAQYQDLTENPCDYCVDCVTKPIIYPIKNFTAEDFKVDN